MTRRVDLPLLAVLGTAAALRLWRLGDWSFDGDECYSLYDVKAVLAGAPWPEGVSSHPLGYMGMALFGWLGGLGEFWLRLFGVLCGLGAVAVLGTLRRDAVARPVGLIAAALAALSPWLIYHSQTARFYAPVLFFASLATLWALPGPGLRPLRAALAWVAAVLCHPSAIVLGAGLIVSSLLRPGPARRTALGVVVVGVGVLGAWSLTGSAITDVVQRALVRDRATDYTAQQFVLGLGYNLGPLVGLTAILGLVAHLRSREPAVLTAAAVACLPPLALLVLALAGVSMHQRYAMAAVPATLLLSGWGLVAAWSYRRPLGFVLGAAVLASQLPSLRGQMLDGNRHDMRGMAVWLAGNATPDDIVVADEHATLELYLHAQPRFASATSIEAPLDDTKMSNFIGTSREVWVVLKSSRLGSAYGSDFMEWLGEHFTAVKRIGRPRPPLVRHDNTLVAYRRNERKSR